MASNLLVAAQFATIAVLAWRWDAQQWNAWGALPIAVAILIAGWTVVHNPPRNFSIFPEPRANARLITSGPYACVRHPMYVALGLFAIGMAIGWNTTVHWVAAAVLAAVLDRKSLREERFLRERFAAYDGYAARTPRFLPALHRAAR